MTAMGDISNPPWINSLTAAISHNQGGARNQPKLQPLELVPCHGTVEQFPKFWENFFALVGSRTEFNDTVKYTYLQQACKGHSKAESVLQEYPPGGTSYLPVVNRLKHKFGNKQLLFDQVNRDLQQRAPATSIKTARAQLDWLFAKLRTLETLWGLSEAAADESRAEMENANSMLITTIKGKLPYKLIEAWNRKVYEDQRTVARTEVPIDQVAPPLAFRYTAREMLEYVEDQLTILEISQQVSEPAASTSGKSGAGKKEESKKDNKGSSAGGTTGSGGKKDPPGGKNKKDAKKGDESRRAKSNSPPTALIATEPLPNLPQPESSRKSNSSNDSGDKSSSKPASNKKTNKPKTETVVYFESGCCWCGKEHDILTCKVLDDLPVTEKWERWRRYTGRKKLCFTCLSDAHLAPKCEADPCGIDGCTKKHHPILHSKKKTDAGEKGRDTQWK